MKANGKSLLIWCAAQAFVIFAGMIKYGGFKDSTVDISALFADMPPALMAMFGMSGIDLTRIDGFYTVFFLYFMLLAGVHAVMLGVVLIAKEERDHSADFLFAKPVTRRRVITAKLAAGLVNAIIFNAVTGLCSLSGIARYNDGDPLTAKVALLMSALIIFQVLFLTLGALLGAALRNARIASSAATGILLGTFFLSVGISYEPRLGFLKFLTPFNYFEARSLMYGGALPFWALALCGCLIAGFSWLTYHRFEQRDLAV